MAQKSVDSSGIQTQNASNELPLLPKEIIISMVLTKLVLEVNAGLTDSIKFSLASCDQRQDTHHRVFYDWFLFVVI